MDEFRQVFLHGLAQHVTALELAREQLNAGDPSGTDAVLRIAHQLKGSGASFGYPAISARAAGVLAADEGARGAEVENLVSLLHRILAEAGASSTLLVVEDDPAVRQLAASTLTDSGWAVTQAASIDEARELMAATAFDGMLLDLILPDGDGRNLLAEIRRDPATAGTALIVLSAHDTPAVKAECFALGADGFLEKPLDPGLLHGLVSTIVRRTGATSTPHTVPTPPGVAVDEPVEGRRAPIVLLAEDDRLTASLVTDRFRRAGYRLIHCTDGESALATAESEVLDAVILDVKMPMMDGFELLARLRRLSPLGDIPILMLTAMGSEDDVVRAFDLGADDYVIKPFSPGELVARVSRLMQRAA